MNYDDDDLYDDDDDDDDAAETVTCPECGEDVYEDVEQCPSCGYYFTAGDRTELNPFWKLVAVIVAIVFFLASGGVALFVWLFD